LGGCQPTRLRRGRSPIDRLDGKRFLWKDVLKLRREQLTAARQELSLNLGDGRGQAAAA
jgi:hypothetical protein